MSTQVNTVPTATELIRSFPQWLKKNVKSTLISAVSGGVMGYISNVWLLAVKYEGSGGIPAGSAATGPSNAVSGGLFWALASSVVFGIAGYWKSVGTKKFIEDLKGLPGVIASLFKSDGRAGQVHLLWGAATALLASVVVSPAIGGVLAIGILLAAPSVIGNIVSTLVFRVWSSLIKLIAPTRKHQTTGILSMTVGLIGAAGALAVTFLVTGMIVKLILAAVCAGAALLLSRQKPPATIMLVMLALVGLVLAQLLSGGVALADDGGWIECGTLDDTIVEHFEQWLTNCPGTAAVLILGLLGAGPAALAAPFGWFLGNLAGNWGGPGRGPGDFPLHQQPPPDDYQKRRNAAIAGWIRGLIDDPAFQQWRALHPEYGSGEPSNAEFEAYMRWRHEQGLEDPPLVLPQEPVYVMEAAPPVAEPESEDWTGMLGPDGVSPLEWILGVEGDPFDPNDPSIEELLFGGGESEGEGQPGEQGQTADPATTPQPSNDPFRERLANTLSWNPNVPLDPSVWNAMEGLSKAVSANNGNWTPQMIDTLRAIESAQGTTSDNHLTQVKTDQLQIANEGMNFIAEQNKKALAMEEQQRNITRQIEAQETYIRKHMEELPTGQWPHVNDMLERFSAGSPNPEMLGRLQELSGVVFNNQQAQHGQEKAGHTNTADYFAAAEQTGRTIQKASIAAQLILAPFAVPLSLAGIARLGAFNLGSNAIEGAGVGYTEGGVRGMIVETARRTLPVNTLEASYNALGNALHPNDPRYKGAGVGGIALGFVQDIGNALTLTAGSKGIRELSRLPTEVPVDTSAVRKLSGEVPPTPKNATDAGWLEGKAKGKDLVDDFRTLNKETKALEAAGGDPAAIDAARRRLAEKAIEIENNYQGKILLKNDKPLGKDFNAAIEPVLKNSGKETVDALNSYGVRRGGRPVNPDDLMDLRNAKNVKEGNVGIDRDLALNEMAERKLLAQLEKADPGSAQAHGLKQKLDDVRAANAWTIDGKPVSAREIHKQAERAYGISYQNNTKIPGRPDGFTAGEGLQGVTWKGHGEAYPDLNVLKNNPAEHSFARGHAESTGAVTTFKANENTRHLKPGDAIQETARGTAKDIGTKLEPLLEAKGARPDVYQRTQNMKEFLDDVGKGRYQPSEAQAIAQQKFGTSIEGLAGQVDSNITAAIKQTGTTHVPGGFKPLAGPGMQAAAEHAGVAARTGVAAIGDEVAARSRDVPATAAPAAQPASRTAAPSYAPAAEQASAAPSRAAGPPAMAPVASARAEPAPAAWAEGPPRAAAAETSSAAAAESPRGSEPARQPAAPPTAARGTGPPASVQSESMDRGQVVSGPPRGGVTAGQSASVSESASAQIRGGERSVEDYESVRESQGSGESQGVKESQGIKESQGSRESQGVKESQGIKESQGVVKSSQGIKESQGMVKESHGIKEGDLGEIKESESISKESQASKSGWFRRRGK